MGGVHGRRGSYECRQESNRKKVTEKVTGYLDYYYNFILYIIILFINNTFV